MKDDLLHTVYLSLGSNIQPEANLPRAVALLQRTCEVQALSNCYQTPAVSSSGAVGEGPDFLNMAVRLRTALDAASFKNQVLAPIENRLGRTRGADKYAPRTIDLDIILFDDQVIDEALWRRVFLAVPLAELKPDLVHAASRRTLEQVADTLRAKTGITPRLDVRFEP